MCKARLLAFVIPVVFGWPALARADAPPFLTQYCVRCHGETKPKADLSLHNLSPNPVKRAEIDAWKEALEKVEAGEMPPDGSKQPSADEKQQFVAAAKTILKNAGVNVDETRWLAPMRGNYVDHYTLFSGKAVDPAATRPRLWRLTGQAYEQFIMQKNAQFRLGIKTYGDSKVRSPWELRVDKEFSDYAHAHRVGDADIEYHLRNVTRVASLMVKKFADKAPSSSDATIPELTAVIKAGKTAKPEQVRAAVVASFDKVLNRTPDAADIDRYVGFFTKNLEAIGAEKAAEQFLIAMLLRPEVLYRIELPSAPGERRIMPPTMLARAISFALTDSEPDEALHKAAGAGKLSTREEVRGHVERMLKDRTTDRTRVLRFFQEYFGYSTAGDVFKDEVTLGEHGLKKNHYAPEIFVNDTDSLVRWVLDQDRNVLRELLTTQKTFVLTGNSKNAAKYRSLAAKFRAGTAPQDGETKPGGFGYPGTAVPDATLRIYEISLHVKDWTDEKPFDFPAGHRMGILTHPSWLIAHSTNFDNHAIDRGRWIRERLLGGRVPEIPITVDATLPDEPHKPLRERMRVTKAEYCWKCHQHMDPLGMPFEQYDHLGRYRAQEMVVDKEATERSVKTGKSMKRVTKTVPNDTSGEVLQSGDPKLDGPVKDVRELITRLATSERVEQVFVRHAFRYFLGRNETLSDGPTLVAAHKAYRDNGGSMKALVASLLTSDSFLYRSTK